MKEKRKRLEQILILIIVIVMIFICGNYKNQKYGFQMKNTDENIHYVRAKVQEVIEQDVSYSDSQELAK